MIKPLWNAKHFALCPETMLTLKKLISGAHATDMMLVFTTIADLPEFAVVPALKLAARGDHYPKRGSAAPLEGRRSSCWHVDRGIYPERYTATDITHAPVIGAKSTLTQENMIKFWQRFLRRVQGQTPPPECNDDKVAAAG